MNQDFIVGVRHDQKHLILLHLMRLVTMVVAVLVLSSFTSTPLAIAQ
jgi:hypothetical protein